MVQTPDAILAGSLPIGTAPGTTSVPPGIKLPLSIQPIGGGVGILVDADGVPVVGDNGMPILRNMDTPGGPGGAGPPQWRPGEFGLAEGALAVDQAAQATAEAALKQRLEELQMQLDADVAMATQNHQNQLALLQKEFENASELEKVRIQHEIDLENLRHENDMKELQVRITAERKNLITSEFGAERRTLIQEQGATKRAVLGLGPDPSKQAIAMGQATRGLTPQQGAVNQAQAFINQPLPQINMNMSLPQMEAALGNLQGIQAPMASGVGMSAPIGLKHGGVIDMEKKDGKFSMKQTVLVGEAGPEVLTVDKGKVQVTPLTGTAQAGWPPVRAYTGPAAPISPWESPHGDPITGEPQVPQPPTPLGTRPLGFEPWLTTWPRPAVGPPALLGSAPPLSETWGTIQNILQNIAPLYAGSSFSQVPTATQPGTGVGGVSLAQLSELGVRPQLVRVLGPAPPGTKTPTFGGDTYFIDAQGQRHLIPGGHQGLIQAGFDPSQVVVISQEELDSFAPGGEFTGQGPQAAGAVTGPSGYGALGAPLIESTSGAVLPAIHTIAGNWQNMSPGQQAYALSAYANANTINGNPGGLNPQMIQDILQTFTPTGRGYGRRIGGIGAQF